MASNQTQHLKLCQWEEEDEVLRADFNADNAKIDAAAAAAEEKIQAIQTQAARFGNCVVVAGSYIGNGGRESGSPCTLRFAHKPLLVLVDGMYILVRGVTSSTVVESGSTNNIHISWGDRAVSWYAVDDWSNQCNSSGRTYYYVAFLDKER